MSEREHLIAALHRVRAWEYRKERRILGDIVFISLDGLEEAILNGYEEFDLGLKSDPEVVKPFKPEPVPIVSVSGPQEKTEYDVLASYKRVDLIQEVNKAMANGWTPIGGITCAPNSFRIKVNCGDDQITSWVWSQAMCKITRT
jgi:hypothetical protein